MKNGKIYTILIATGFCLAVLFSFFFIFRIEKIDINFSVDENTNVSSVYDSFLDYKGKSYLFLDINNISLSKTDFPNFYIDSTEKVFPNILKINIKERVGVYKLQYDNKMFVLDKDGYILSIDGSNYNQKKLIEIEFNGLNVLTCDLGDKLVTDDDNFLSNVYNMCLAVNLTDCIKSVKIVKDIEVSDTIFNTNTGVKIVVYKSNENGNEKIKKAFEVYDGLADDYQKSFKELDVYQEQDGEIKVIFPS